jgi:CheY-like chemotaxis protein
VTWIIAEDEADIRNLIATMFQIWGHNTVAFENGQKVWEWLDKVERNEQAALPELPGKKGNELANRMRSIPALRKTPIVLMTAFSLSDQERQSMMTSDGVDHILNKPLPDFDQLRLTLHHIRDHKGSAQ